VIDQLRVEKGYEAALGAALGDDLEAPVEPSAPMRWAGAEYRSWRSCAARQCFCRLSQFVNAPHELARRLAQIGVIERENAASLTPLLRPGQRLVSREGDLWRWTALRSLPMRRPARRGALPARTGSPTSRPSCRRHAAMSAPAAGGRECGGRCRRRFGRGDRGPLGAGASCSGRLMPRATATQQPSAN